METAILYPHISINVSNLERSVAFYTAFFGAEPLKVRSGYAKFELQEPKLNFAMNERPDVRATDVGSMNHFGLQVASTDDVLLADLRLRKLGLRTIPEEGTVCCYALQDKIWVDDPDGIHWEIFVVHSDAESYREPNADSGMCCTPAPIQISPAIAI